MDEVTTDETRYCDVPLLNSKVPRMPNENGGQKKNGKTLCEYFVHLCGCVCVCVNSRALVTEKKWKEIVGRKDVYIS